jgi:hypothetical protein
MKTYKVKLEFETEVEAESKEEAEMKFFDEEVNDAQSYATSFIAEHITIKEIKQ